MVKVYLHGALGKEVGEEWDLDISTPREAFRAIEANTQKLFKYLIEKDKEGIKYNVFLDNDSVGEEELELDISHRTKIHVVPQLDGASDWGTFWEGGGEYGSYLLAGGYTADAISSSGLIGDGWFASAVGWLGNLSMEAGAALILQGLISTLMEEPEHPEVADKADPLETSSFIFQNPINNVAQGEVVPVGYGRLRIGSHVLSSSILNSRSMDYKSITPTVTESISSIPPGLFDASFGSDLLKPIFQKTYVDLAWARL